MNPKPQGYLKAVIKFKIEPPTLFANDFSDGNKYFQPVSRKEFSFRCWEKNDKGAKYIGQGHLGKFCLFFWAPESSHIITVPVALLAI